MNDSTRIFIHTKQLNTHTQPEQPNSAVFIIKLRKKLANFVHFNHHKFCRIYQSYKICTWLAKPFCTFHSFLHESSANTIELNILCNKLCTSINRPPTTNYLPTDQPTVIHQPPTNWPQSTNQLTTNQLQRPSTDRRPTNKKFEHQKNNNFIFYINYDFEKIKHRVLVPYTECL